MKTLDQPFNFPCLPRRRRAKKKGMRTMRKLPASKVQQQLPTMTTARNARNVASRVFARLGEASIMTRRHIFSAFCFAMVLDEMNFASTIRPSKPSISYVSQMLLFQNMWVKNAGNLTASFVLAFADNRWTMQCCVFSNGFHSIVKAHEQ